METKSHDSVRALANPLSDYVVVKVFDRRALSTELLVFRSRRALHLVNLRLVKGVTIHVLHRLRFGFLFIFLVLNVLASLSSSLGRLRWA